MYFLKTFNYNDEENNSNIYSIELELGDIYSKYYGKIIENLELGNNYENPIIGYISNKEKNVNYIIFGYRGCLKDEFKFTLIDCDSKCCNLNLFFTKEDDKYIGVNNISDRHKLNKAQMQDYDSKTHDKTKRKVLNYFYDLGNK